MTRDYRKTLVYLEILLRVAKNLRGNNTHLLIHESVTELYLWCGQHQRNTAQRYYDYENPENTAAEFMALLNAPLGQLLLGADFPDMELNHLRLKALQAQEERKLYGDLSAINQQLRDQS
jgi:hypothetical protein